MRIDMTIFSRRMVIVLVVVLLLSGCSALQASDAFVAPGAAVAGTGMDVPNPPQVLEAGNAAVLAPLAQWGSGEVQVLALTPDEQTLVVGTSIGVLLYDRSSLMLQRTLPTGAMVTRLAITPDGATLAALQRDGALVLWNLADGAQLHVIDARGPRRDLRTRLFGHDPFQSIESLAFSPDGAILAGDTSHGQLTLWDVSRGTLLAELGADGRRTTSLAFSPDGTLLAAGGGWQSPDGDSGWLELWDVAQRRLLHTLDGHTNVVQSLQFSADGRELWSADEDAELRQWHVGDGILIADQEYDNTITLLSSDRLLIEPYDPPAILIQPGERQPIAELDLLPLWRDLGLFAAGATTLVALSAGDTLSQWDLSSGRLLQREQLPDHGTRLNGLAISPDGSTILVGRDDGSVALRDAHDGTVRGELRAHDAAVMRVLFSPDGQLVAVGSEDGTVSIWNWPDRTLLQQLPTKLWWVEGIAFSPDSRQLVVLAPRAERSMLQLWHIADGRQEWEQDAGESIGNVVLVTPDGMSIVAGFWDGSIRQWNISDGSLAREIRPASPLSPNVTAIQLSPDEKTAAVLISHNVFELWETDAWTRIKRYQGRSMFANQVAFSPDGTLLAAVSGVDNMLQVWDTKAGGAPLISLRHHTWEVQNVVFSPDQTRIYTASRDGTVRVWGLAE